MCGTQTGFPAHRGTVSSLALCKAPGFPGSKVKVWRLVPKMRTPLPRVAVEALKGLPSYGVDDYVFPSRSTAKWPDPKKPYRWDMGKPFRALVRSLGIGISASTTSGIPDRRRS